jgi:hypothetical protein
METIAAFDFDYAQAASAPFAQTFEMAKGGKVDSLFAQDR